MEKKIKILFLAAGADEKSRKRLEQEAREIGARLWAGKERDSFELITEWAVRAGDLQKHLLRHQPHILHLGGLANKAGDILLADNSENPRPVNGRALAELFRLLKDNIKVVVFSVAHSDALARDLTETIDYAISMSGRIDSQTAVTFSTHFYQGLSYGRNVVECFELAKNQLMLEGNPEYEKPVLHIREGADAAPT